MSLSTSAMKLLAEYGLTIDQIITVSEANDAPIDGSAERRRAYDRDRKRKAKDGNSTGIPPEQSMNHSTGIPPEFHRNSPPLARVLNNNLTTEVTGLAVVAVVEAHERDADDWPKGDARNWSDALVSEASSHRLDPSKSPALITTMGELLRWKTGGASWRFDVVPAVLAATRKTGPPIGSWKFFEKAIAQSVADNRKALEIPEASNERRSQPTAKRVAREDNFSRSLEGFDAVAYAKPAVAGGR
jgi:hypothetical protein